MARVEAKREKEMNSSSPRIGDRIRIDRIPVQVGAGCALFPETRRIFEAAVGGTFEVRGFNDPGMLEVWLRPDGREDHTGGGDSIWIEKECVSLCECSE